ncbi:hypothetical protein HOY82DRAFT_367126 [Tuber indicum]|nr:hypothetical protein HOY82DRAFT_367126 [Tuber indicum]
MSCLARSPFNLPSYPFFFFSFSLFLDSFLLPSLTFFLLSFFRFLLFPLFPLTINNLFFPFSILLALFFGGFSHHSCSLFYKKIGKRSFNSG